MAGVLSLDVLKRKIQAQPEEPEFFSLPCPKPNVTTVTFQ